MLYTEKCSAIRITQRKNTCGNDWIWKVFHLKLKWRREFNDGIIQAFPPVRRRLTHLTHPTHPPCKGHHNCPGERTHLWRTSTPPALFPNIPYIQKDAAVDSVVGVIGVTYRTSRSLRIVLNLGIDPNEEFPRDKTAISSEFQAFEMCRTNAIGFNLAV